MGCSPMFSCPTSGKDQTIAYWKISLLVLVHSVGGFFLTLGSDDSLFSFSLTII